MRRLLRLLGFERREVMTGLIFPDVEVVWVHRLSPSWNISKEVEEHDS